MSKQTKALIVVMLAGFFGGSVAVFLGIDVGGTSLNILFSINDLINYSAWIYGVSNFPIMVIICVALVGTTFYMIFIQYVIKNGSIFISPIALF